MQCMNLVASLVMAAVQLPVLLECNCVHAASAFDVACCLLLRMPLRFAARPTAFCSRFVCFLRAAVRLHAG